MATIKNEFDYIQEARSQLAEALVNKFGVREQDILNADGSIKSTGLWASNSDGSKNYLKRLHDWATLVTATNVHTDASLTFKDNGEGDEVGTTFNGSVAKSISYNSIGAAPASHTHTTIVAEDLRSKYPGRILDPQRMKLSFLDASTLGIKNDGSYYDVITVRSYKDSSGGSDNALLFSKNTNSLYHTRFEFNSTSSWGSPLLIIDSGNIGSQSVKYASSASNATTATKLTSSAGSATLPIYFSDGKPVACTASSVFSSLSNSGNDLSITVAGKNRTLTVNYATTASQLNNTSVSDPNTAASDQNVKWYSQISQSSGYAGTNYGFPVSNNANGILWLGTHYGSYGWQMGFSGNGRIYARHISNNSFSTSANGGSWNRIAWTSDIPTSLKNPYTLTLQAGTFATKTYDGSAAVTVNIPTHTSHLINNSGFLTQHQSLSNYVTLNTAQTITGAKNFSNNLTLSAGDEDRYITFNYTGGTGYDWRIGYLGSGSGDANYFVIQNDKTDGTYVNALRIRLTTLASVFGGTVTSSGFVKSDSSNSYVLLGGGGHKLISDFATSEHTHSYLPLYGGTVTGTLNVKNLVVNPRIYESRASDSNLVFQAYMVNNNTKKAHNYGYGADVITFGKGWTEMTPKYLYYNGYIHTTEYMRIKDVLLSYDPSNNTLNLSGASEQTVHLAVDGTIYSGTIITPGNDKVVIKPPRNNWDKIGGENEMFCEIWATTFYGSEYYSSSDIRYKNIIKHSCIDLSNLAALPLFLYTWKDKRDNTIHIGSSAQAVEQVIPQLVTENSKGFKSLNYSILGTVAGITACKELVTQKSELQQLKEKVKQLEDKLRKYENI